jgi:AcrR family transcriptional regulator
MRRPKQARILETAASLFVEYGFEGTTFRKVSKKSGAAVGSIIHFFGDKAGLAAGVYDDFMSRLAADARVALRGHADDIEAAVRAVISACLGWDKKFPYHSRLIGMLEPSVPKSGRSRPDDRQHDLPKVLAEWAESLPSKKKIAPLSPDQLYAVILAPAIHIGRPAGAFSPDARMTSSEWAAILTKAALCALGGPTRKVPSPRAGSGQAKAAQRDLYDRAS